MYVVMALEKKKKKVSIKKEKHMFALEACVHGQRTKLSVMIIWQVISRGEQLDFHYKAGVNPADAIRSTCIYAKLITWRIAEYFYWSRIA